MIKMNKIEQKLKIHTNTQSQQIHNHNSIIIIYTNSLCIYFR
jgi:hypothetical protein